MSNVKLTDTEIESLKDSINEKTFLSYLISIDGLNLRFTEYESILGRIIKIISEYYKSTLDKVLKKEIKSVISVFNGFENWNGLELCKFVFKYFNKIPGISLYRDLKSYGMFGKVASTVNISSIKSIHASPKPKEVQSVFDDEKTSLIKTLSETMKKSPRYKIICNDDLSIDISLINEDDVISIDKYQYCSFHSRCDITNFKSISKNLRSRMGLGNIYGFITTDNKCYDCCFNIITEGIRSEEKEEIKKIRNKINNVLSSIQDNVIAFNNDIKNRDEMKKKYEIQRNQCDKLESDFIINFGKIAKSAEIKPLIMHQVLSSETVRTELKGRETKIVKNVDLNPFDYVAMSSFFGSRKFQEVSLLQDNIKLILSFLDYTDTELIIEIPNQSALSLLRKKSQFKLKIIKNVQVYITKVSSLNYKVRIELTINDDTIIETFDYKTQRIIIEDGDDSYLNTDAKIYPSYTSDNYRCGIIEIGKTIVQEMGFNKEIEDNHEVLFYIGSCFVSNYQYINRFIMGDENRTTIGISEEINEVKINFEKILDSDHELRFLSNDINNDLRIFKLYEEMVERGEIEDNDNLLGFYLKDHQQGIIKMRSKIYKTLSDVDFMSNENILNLSSGEKIKINDEQYNEIMKYYSNIPYIHEDYLEVGSYEVKIDMFNEFIDELKSCLSDLSNKFKLSKSKSFDNNNLTANQMMIDSLWNEDENDDTKSVSSIGTSATNLTDKSLDPETGKIVGKKLSDSYEEGFFDKSFKIDKSFFQDNHDVEFTGHQAKKLLSIYSRYTDFDFVNRNAFFKIDTINIIPENIDYILSNLFEDEDIIIQNDGQIETVIYNRYLRAMIIFASKTKSFRIFNDGKYTYINIKHEINKLSPYDIQNKLASSSIGKKTTLPRKLINYLDCSKTIDGIYLRFNRNLIEHLGDEFFKSIFTAFQITENGTKIGIRFSNKNKMVKLINEMIDIKIMLLNKYEGSYMNFLNDTSKSVYDVDGYDDKFFEREIANHTLFSRSCTDIQFSDMVFPSNPLLSYDIDDVIYESYLPVPSDKILHLETKQASDDLNKLFMILYPNDELVTIGDIFSDEIITILSMKNNRRKEFILLSLMMKFFEVVKLFKKVDQEIYDNVIQLRNAIFYNEIKRVRQPGDTLPGEQDFEEYFNDLIYDYKEFIGDSLITINRKIFNNGKIDDVEFQFIPVSLFDSILGLYDLIFVNDRCIFYDRRERITEYISNLIREIINVRCNQNGEIEEYHPFENYENYDINNALKCLDNVIKSLKNDKFDPTLKLSELKDGRNDLISGLDLNIRAEIFHEFSKFLLYANDFEKFKAIRKSFAYYLVTKIPKSTYKSYYHQNYSSLFYGNDMDIFNDKQTFMINSLKEIDVISSNINVSKSSVNKTENELKRLISSINERKESLLSLFTENVSIVDIIIKSYETEKVSYEDEKIEFREMIDDMKIALSSIKREFSKIDHIYFKILISMFNDNSRINAIRKNVFSIFDTMYDKTDDKSLKYINDVVNSSLLIIKRFIDHNSKDVFRIINTELNKYNLDLKSSNNTIQNVIRTIDRKDRNSTIINIASHKFTYEFFSLIDEKIIEIKRDIMNNKVDEIFVTISEEKPKIRGYDLELNKNLSQCFTDEFSKKDIKILSDNIKYFIDRVQNSMLVFDSGPGLHLLSDIVESLILYIEETDVENFDKFVEKYNRFTNFMKGIGKTIPDIVGSSDFPSFISIINGSFSEMKSITSNINFFDVIPDVYKRYDDISPDIFRSLFDFFLWIIEFFNSDGNHENDNNTIFINQINTFSGSNYEDIKDLINILKDINSAIIPFIDEYIDDSGNILNDIQVIEYYKEYNLLTRGRYMAPLFRKLNRCILKYVDEKETELIKEIKGRFLNYCELFLTKFKTITSLDEFMIRR